MQIGKVTLKNNVVLAPMAGVTDSPFRRLVKEMGCALVYSEMVSAKGTIYAPEQTLKLTSFKESERPIAIQLFGGDPAIFAQAAVICAQLAPEIIDINMGCPVKKVAGKGEGCALMREPARAFAIVQAVCQAVELPVTVKMRTGWNDNDVNAVEVSLAVQEAGAAAVTVHGRTREQGYSGCADWSIIKAVKEALSIPVIGNGDIWKPEDASRMLTQTGCDGVMLARGVMGNPWLIRRTVHYLETGTLLPEPELSEKVAMAHRHLQLAVQAKGEYIAVREMRKQIAWYLKGIPGAASVRNKIMRTEKKREVEQILFSLQQV